MTQIQRILTVFSLLWIWQTSWATISGDAGRPDLTDQTALHQFTSSGHVVGFKPGELYVASMNHALQVKFINAQGISPIVPETQSITGEKMQPFTQATYQELWPGINLSYTPGGGIIQSTYTLQPGAKVNDIGLQYNVPINLQKNGQLQLIFETGQLTESAPIAWQVINGYRKTVDVSFKQLAKNNQLGFQVGDYDETKTLYIDPTLTWHTFLGGSSHDEATSLSVDNSGNLYVAGYSNETWGSPLNSHAGTANPDMVVAKLNSSGVLQWHTFLGGTSWDSAYGLSIDSSDNLYVVGKSFVTWGTPVNAHSGGVDIVVAKLNSSGTLQWNTFLGGANDNESSSIILDNSGNLYIAGQTNASWGTAVNAYAGGWDMVIAKLDNTGVRQWHTFLGGTNNDFAYSLKLDSSDNLYVAGAGDSSWGSPLSSHSGSNDMIVAKLNNNGALQWHTFLGGTGADVAYGLDRDSSDNLYVAGYSNANWGVSPVNAFSSSHDIVVIKLDSAGTQQWHSFAGGSGTDVAQSIQRDSNGNIYVAGYSSANWGVNPENAYSSSNDIVIVKLDSSGNLDRHTFLGGTAGDFAASLGIDSNDNLYITGRSDAAWGSPVNGYAGGAEMIAAKLGITLASVPEINLQGNGSDITSGDTTPDVGDDTDFGSIDVNSSSLVRTYTIQNTGAGTLNLTGTPIIAVSGAQSSDFSVTTQPSVSIASNGSTTFVVTFNPSASGIHSATLSINNDDSDENPYTFTVQGTGTLSPAEISVQANSLNIASGDTTPTAIDYTYFGDVLVNSSSRTRTFTIQNTGPGTLDLTGTPVVAISGAQSSNFIVTTQPASVNIPPNSNTTFVVTFIPSFSGIHYATLSIDNNDSNEALFTFDLKGNGIFPSTVQPVSNVEEEPLQFIQDSDINDQQSVVDLTTDLVSQSELIEHVRSTPQLTDVEQQHIEYTHDETTGLLQLKWGELNSNLRPISVTQAELGEVPGLAVNDDGNVQMITENGRKLILQAEPSALDDLIGELNEVEFQLKRDDNNNLKVTSLDDAENGSTNAWYNVRPALLSEPDNDVGKKVGIEVYEYNNLPGVFGYIHRFNKNGKLFQQHMYAMPIGWDGLKGHLKTMPSAESVSINGMGVIKVKLDGVEYSGQVDAKVNPIDTTQPSVNEVQLIHLGDVNGDDKTDYKVVYPNGQSQTLYLLRP